MSGIIDIQWLLQTGNVRKMKDVSFAEYIVAAAEYFRVSDERMGQAYFNTLHVIRPDIADAIRGSDDDAFYNNELLPQMLAVVHKSW